MRQAGANQAGEVEGQRRGREIELFADRAGCEPRWTLLDQKPEDR
jgi:hypothetical protein